MKCFYIIIISFSCVFSGCITKRMWNELDLQKQSIIHTEEISEKEYINFLEQTKLINSNVFILPDENICVQKSFIFCLSVDILKGVISILTIPIDLLVVIGDEVIIRYDEIPSIILKHFIW